MEMRSILHDCMEKEVKVFTIKERFELGNNINSEVLAFAFSFSAEIERQLISQRTKEALARRKREGEKLGQLKGSLSKKNKTDWERRRNPGIAYQEHQLQRNWADHGRQSGNCQQICGKQKFRITRNQLNSTI